jgi:hypothetical protein
MNSASSPSFPIDILKKLVDCKVDENFTLNEALNNLTQIEIKQKNLLFVFLMRYYELNNGTGNAKFSNPMDKFIFGSMVQELSLEWANLCLKKNTYIDFINFMSQLAVFVPGCNSLKEISELLPNLYNSTDENNPLLKGGSNFDILNLLLCIFIGFIISNSVIKVNSDSSMVPFGSYDSAPALYNGNELTSEFILGSTQLVTVDTSKIVNELAVTMSVHKLLQQPSGVTQGIIKKTDIYAATAAIEANGGIFERGIVPPGLKPDFAKLTPSEQQTLHGAIMTLKTMVKDQMISKTDTTRESLTSAHLLFKECMVELMLKSVGVVKNIDVSLPDGQKLVVSLKQLVDEAFFKLTEIDNPTSVSLIQKSNITDEDAVAVADTTASSSVYGAAPNSEVSIKPVSGTLVSKVSVLQSCGNQKQCDQIQNTKNTDASRIIQKQLVSDIETYGYFIEASGSPISLSINITTGNMNLYIHRGGYKPLTESIMTFLKIPLAILEPLKEAKDTNDIQGMLQPLYEMWKSAEVKKGKKVTADSTRTEFYEVFSVVSKFQHVIRALKVIANAEFAFLHPLDLTQDTLSREEMFFIAVEYFQTILEAAKKWNFPTTNEELESLQSREKEILAIENAASVLKRQKTGVAVANAIKERTVVLHQIVKTGVEEGFEYINDVFDTIKSELTKLRNHNWVAFMVTGLFLTTISISVLGLLIQIALKVSGVTLVVNIITRVTKRILPLVISITVAADIWERLQIMTNYSVPSNTVANFTTIQMWIQSIVYIVLDSTGMNVYDCKNPLFVTSADQLCFSYLKVTGLFFAGIVGLIVAHYLGKFNTYILIRIGAQRVIIPMPLEQAPGVVPIIAAVGEPVAAVGGPDAGGKRIKKIKNNTNKNRKMNKTKKPKRSINKNKKNNKNKKSQKKNKKSQTKRRKNSIRHK